MVDIKTSSDAEIMDRRDEIELEKQLVEIDAVVGDRARARREGAAKERQDHLKAVQAEIVVLAAERLQAIADMEAGARKYAEALNRAEGLNTRMAKLTLELSGERWGTPPPLGESEFASRLSGRTSAIMQQTLPKPYRRAFGSITWGGASRYAHADDWKLVEDRLLEPHLRQLIEKKV